MMYNDVFQGNWPGDQYLNVFVCGAVGTGTDQVFYQNDQTVTLDYSIEAGKNAMSAGPIAIAASKTVTIPAGSEWSIV